MHLEGVIKGGAGGGKKDAKMLIAQLLGCHFLQY